MAGGAHPDTQRSTLPILGEAGGHSFADAQLDDVLEGLIGTPHHLEGLRATGR